MDPVPISGIPPSEKRPRIAWRLLRTIIILPGTALVLIPAIILWTTAESSQAGALATLSQPQLWFALAIGGTGFFFAVWTVTLFVTRGDGTPAPWDPPQKLVIRGPYRHVRNPMISSVLLLLLAEALLFQSWPLAAWMLVFYTANSIYFPLSEEKGLERRFGEDYRTYKANVPRWVPRLRPWRGP